MFKKAPETTFLVHGDDEPMAAQAERIKKDLGWTVAMPAWKEQVVIG